jgi:HK97 family phage prohead protease
MAKDKSRRKVLFRIAERVLNVPLCVTREKLDAILSVLGPRMGLDMEVTPADFEEAERRDIYSQTEDGIAVLDIAGVLVNRGFGMVDAESTPLYSYEELRMFLGRAEADRAVQGIVLRIESPGGEHGGLPDFAEYIDQVSRSKPVWAVVDDYAFSAAFWIACATNRIYISSSGGVGSVGVISKHVDLSEREKMLGVKVTTVFAGARKNDFSADAPLTTEAAQRLEAIVSKAYDQFVSAVAKFRNLSKTAVRATEADTYFGSEAIDAGLADRMGTFDQALDAMRSMLARNQRDDLRATVSLPKPENRGPALVQEFRGYALAPVKALAEPEPKLAGHLAVFNEWSASFGPFIERIMPGAFQKSLKEGDIHLLWNHDGAFVLGRNKSGTLTLFEDETGLAFECSPPDTQLVRDLVLEPIRRGDVDQGSFAFLPIRQEWGRMDGELTRTLHEVRLFHVAILPKGAYPQTDVALRALDGAIDFTALAAIEAKLRFDLPLSDGERETLKPILAMLERAGNATPGHAAHLAKPAGAPPPQRETPARRLRLLKLARSYNFTERIA